jgi:hypothetical protein
MFMHQHTVEIKRSRQAASGVHSTCRGKQAWQQAQQATDSSASWSSRKRGRNRP